MEERTQGPSEVEQFILECIDSVPHLEALLLVWENRPKTWTLEELGRRLYLKPEQTKRIMEELVRDQLLAAAPGSPEGYVYEPKSESHDRLMQDVHETYRRELVRISNLIYSKPPAPLREFPRAFRFTTKRE